MLDINNYVNQDILNSKQEFELVTRSLPEIYDMFAHLRNISSSQNNIGSKAYDDTISTLGEKYEETMNIVRLPNN